MPRAKTLLLILCLLCCMGCPVAARAVASASPGVRSATLDPPFWTFCLIFLPLHSPARILSFINIKWEAKGAVRLEVSSHNTEALCLGLPLTPSAKGRLTHGMQEHPPPNSAATNMKSETFAVKLFPFCSAPLQSCSSVFVSQWAVFPLGTCGIWHAKPWIS